VHAIDMKNGKLEWDQYSNWSLERMLAGRDTNKLRAITSWLNLYLDNRLRPALLLENSTTGTLSTDNEFVYVVEDFTVPPPRQAGMQFNPGFQPQPGGAYSQEISDAVAHSRLQAYELSTNGKLKWELGSLGEKDELSDSFFLGPPLPLGGKLYVL